MVNRERFEKNLEDLSRLHYGQLRTEPSADHIDYWFFEGRAEIGIRVDLVQQRFQVIESRNLITRTLSDVHTLGFLIDRTKTFCQVLATIGCKENPHVYSAVSPW